MRLLGAEEIGRFELGGLLGEGADMQAFEAVDAESGARVVVKRPHPTLVSRGMHGDVEKRTLLQAEVRARIGDANGLVRLYGLSERGSFGWYFGDDLGHPYPVLVEERARGIPLVGSVSDMVRGHPVGLPLNLFALHPAKAYVSQGYENPVFTVLGVIERVYGEGYLAQDLGPQNVFYSPGSGESRVIDLGTLREPSAATSRRAAFDLNDILFDAFRLYTTPENPPREAAGFARTREFRMPGTLERRAEALSREYATANDDRSDGALRVLSKIGQREYVAVSEFRRDLQDYLAIAMTIGRDEVTEQAWRQALEGLTSPYWKKYLFEGI